MSYCPHCGARINPDDRFCPSCGRPLTETRTIPNYYLPKKKDIVICVILTIITCGIYGLFWMASVNDEINSLADERNSPSGAFVVVVTLLTCGIYGFFWAYQMAKKCDRIMMDTSSERTILFLVFYFLVLNVVNLCFMQDIINMHAEMEA
ncbi:MAG: DUF4234 domain-containing protein [Solobacterium sp.]|nr:DUF4234 domain-containing protein [Solobacterium sp.]